MEIYEYNNLSDPEQQRHALAALRQFNIDRNRMSLNEFVTYEPRTRRWSSSASCLIAGVNESTFTRM